MEEQLLCGEKPKKKKRLREPHVDNAQESAKGKYSAEIKIKYHFTLVRICG